MLRSSFFFNQKWCSNRVLNVFSSQPLFLTEKHQQKGAKQNYKLDKSTKQGQRIGLT